MNNNNYNFNNPSFKDFAGWLYKLSPTEFVTLGTIASYLISYGLTVNEQNSIGNWLEMVGQIILTFNAQETTLSNASSQNNYNKIIDRLNELEKELKSIKDNHS